MPIALRNALSPKPPAPAPTSKPLQNTATASKPVQAAAARPPAEKSKPQTKAAASGDYFADSFERAKPAANKPVGIVPDGVNPTSKSSKSSGSAPVPVGRTVSGTAQVGTKPAAEGPTLSNSVESEIAGGSRRGVERSGSFGGPSRNQQSQGSGNSPSATIFSVGDEAKVGRSVGNDDVGASIGAEASYNAEVSAGKDGVHVDIGGEVRAGAEAHASHTEGPFTTGASVFAGGRADAGVNFDVGPDGARGSAHAGAFIGVEGSVHGGIHTEHGGIDGTLTGQLGVGADADAYFEVTPDGRIQFGAGAGLAFGPGLKAGLSGELNLVEIANDVKPYIEDAQDVAENVVEGAQDVAENVVEGAQDITEAVGDFFGF
jgi:hypothetical protein